MMILTGFVLVTNFKRSYLMITPMLLFMVAGIFIENIRTQGWYKYYTIDLLQTHRVETNTLYHLLVEFLYQDLFSTCRSWLCWYLPAYSCFLAAKVCKKLEKTAILRDRGSGLQFDHPVMGIQIERRKLFECTITRICRYCNTFWIGRQ